MKYTDNPAPVTLRVRNHRRKAALLADLQTLIKRRGSISCLDALEDLVEALQKEEQEQLIPRDFQP